MVLVADTHFGDMFKDVHLTPTQAIDIVKRFNETSHDLSAWVHMTRFLAGAKHRLVLAKRDRWLQERAYAEGKMDGHMVGRSAMQAARVLYFDDGEAAVCYMNGVGDATAGL